MKCESYTYKKFIVYHNRSKKFGSTYIIVVNPKRKQSDGYCCHCHISGGDSLAKQIIDCAIHLDKFGFTRNVSRIIKNKSCRLNGLYIKYR